MLYKGYIETKGKAAVEKFKNKTRFKTYEQVKDLPGFGGVLENDTILIDIDDYEQSEIIGRVFWKGGSRCLAEKILHV